MGCRMYGMWDAQDMRYLGCGKFWARHVWNVGYSGCGMFGMWHIWDVGCLECEMFGMREVQDVGCLGCGVFQMLVYWGCAIFAAKWDVRLQNVFFSMLCNNDVFKKIRSYWKRWRLNMLNWIALCYIQMD